jgi:hypothetical protein
VFLFYILHVWPCHSPPPSLLSLLLMVAPVNLLGHVIMQ